MHSLVACWQTCQEQLSLQHREVGSLHMQLDSPKVGTGAVAPTLGLQRWPHVHQLMAGLVGGGEVAGIPGWCADRWDSTSCEQEACWRRLLRLKLCWNRSLGVCLSQALDVTCVPAIDQASYSDWVKARWRGIARPAS